MHIAMVGSRGIPARAGGVERVVQELSRELSVRGHDVIVYARRHYVRGSDEPAPVRRIVTPGLSGKHLDTITHTATAMLDVLRRGADVVHVHSPGPALLSWVPALAGLPIVLTVHAPDWRRDKWSPPARAAIRAGLACGMRLAGAVTAVSRPLAKELSHSYGRQVHYVPNGVRAAMPAPLRDIAGWGLKSNGFGLYVGRIVPEKRLDVLLRAWSAVGTDVPLAVVGDGGQGRYGRRCRLLAGPNVLFLGSQYGRTLAELYSHAAFLVQPSVLEGMSLVLLEAASYGRCIIAADIPANREVMADSVLYFSGDDVSQLAGQIDRCLNAEALRSRLGSAARQLIVASYSWSGAAERMTEIYQRVISTKPVR